MKAGVIAQVIEDFAPLSLQESWDNCGFIIGNRESEVHRLLLGFDCTEALLEEAVSTGADMIVTHHPLIFGGVKKISPADPLGRMLIRAIKQDIVIYACHTNIDKVLSGVSGTLAGHLGLQRVQVLDADPDGNGLGVIGFLPEPMSGEAFVKMLKERLSLRQIRTSAPLPQVRKVALCGGSGHSLIGRAYSAGADVYVSGDIGYHDFFCPDHFMIADIGHFESEVGVLGKISEILRKKIPNFVPLIGTCTVNPVHYY